MYQGKFAAAKPAPASADPAVAPKKRKGTVIFYSIYGAFVLCVLIAIFCLMIPLHNWLETYEASQPEKKSAQVFSQLFEDPDWAALYTQAGMTDTAFENKDTYAAYMVQKVGQTPLTCTETSAGLSGDRKYIVRLDEEKIASFTLTDTTGGQAEIAQWELGKVELFTSGNNAVTVQKLPGQTVYINGIALNEDYTIRKISTAAQDYLPEGVDGYRLEQQQVEGLLMPPQVEVTDAQGNAVPTVVDENGIVCVQVPTTEISQEEQELAIGAAKANALFAIRAISTWQLQQHFDKDSQIYKDICATAVFIQDYTGYSFDDSVTAVSDYYRYSDSLFSANVVLELNVTRTNGTVKTFHASTTYFFTKNSSGKYLVTNITNIPVQQLQQQVRITFMQDSEQDTQFIAVDAATLTLPEAPAPEGQTLKGWATQTRDSSGRNVMTIVFTPTEGNVVTLSPDTPLEPMTLYPVFEKEG